MKQSAKLAALKDRVSELRGLAAIAVRDLKRAQTRAVKQIKARDKAEQQLAEFEAEIDERLNI